MPLEATHLVVIYQLIHATRTEGSPDDVSDRCAGVNVADKVWLSLTGVCAFFQQDNLRGLHRLNPLAPCILFTIKYIVAICTCYRNAPAKPGCLVPETADDGAANRGRHGTERTMLRTRGAILSIRTIICDMAPTLWTRSVKTKDPQGSLTVDWAETRCTALTNPASSHTSKIQSSEGTAVIHAPEC